MTICPECGAAVDNQADFCTECERWVELDESGSKPGVRERLNGSLTFEFPDRNGIDMRHLAASLLLALLPAAVLVSAFPPLREIGLLVGLLVFGLLAYQRPTVKTAFGRLSYWTAILFFISPLPLLIYANSLMAQAEPVERSAAAIEGSILLTIAVFVGYPLGAVFYKLADRYGLDQ